MNNGFELVCMSYESMDYDTLYGQYLTAEESRKVEKAVDKRKREFLCGRLCAKVAYARLCGKPFDSRISVLNDCAGTPFFVDGAYRVSLSHDHGLAAALVMERERMRAGLDVQKISPKNTEVIYRSLKFEEKALFDTLSEGIDRDLLAAAFWSAKEAMSKLFEFGFSVFDALEVLNIQKQGDLFQQNKFLPQEKGSLTVSFKQFSAFRVLVRIYSGFAFAFAAGKNEVESFGSDSLRIQEVSVNALK